MQCNCGNNVLGMHQTESQEKLEVAENCVQAIANPMNVVYDL